MIGPRRVIGPVGFVRRVRLGIRLAGLGFDWEGRCERCGRRFRYEDVRTGEHVCLACGWGQLEEDTAYDLDLTETGF